MNVQTSYSNNTYLAHFKKLIFPLGQGNTVDIKKLLFLERHAKMREVGFGFFFVFGGGGIRIS